MCPMIGYMVWSVGKKRKTSIQLNSGTLTIQAFDYQPKESLDHLETDRRDQNVKRPPFFVVGTSSEYVQPQQVESDLH